MKLLPLFPLFVACASLGAEREALAADPPAPPPAAPAPPPEPAQVPLHDTPQVTPAYGGELKNPSAFPFRNSTFLFDQSVSTQTARVETSPELTVVPVYEWWLSFRPRYYFSDSFYVSARLDYFKEFTNSEQTTDYRADVFGDVWTNLVYDTKVPAISESTKVAVGLRLLFPTSLASQNSGIYVQAGLTAGVKQAIPLNGPSATFLRDAHVALGAWYNHPFSRATTPTDPNLGYAREDTGGRSFLSDQLSGATLVNHQLVTSIDAGLQITRRLSFSADFILVNQWHYAPTNGAVATDTGPAEVQTPPGFGTTFVADTWLLTSLDYELIDEVTLSLGYYNRANELGPDGQRRGLWGEDNIWWSPSARFFFDITANLDDIYLRASGTKTNPPELENRNITTASSRGVHGVGL